MFIATIPFSRDCVSLQRNVTYDLVDLRFGVIFEIDALNCGDGSSYHSLLSQRVIAELNYYGKSIATKPTNDCFLVQEL